MNGKGQHEYGSGYKRNENTQEYGHIVHFKKNKRYSLGPVFNTQIEPGKKHYQGKYDQKYDQFPGNHDCTSPLKVLPLKETRATLKKSPGDPPVLPAGTGKTTISFCPVLPRS